MKKSTVSTIFLSAMLCASAGILSACGETEPPAPTPEAPAFSASSYTYDLTTDQSFSAGLDTKGETLTSVSVGETVLGTEAYTLTDGTLTVSESTMQGLTVADYALKAVTAGGTATATLTVSRTVIPPVFGAESYTYDLTACGDLAIAVDLKGAEIKNVYLDTATLAAEAYTYADGTLTVKEAYLLGATLGDHAISVETTTGAETVTVNVIESASAPEFANSEYVYDLSVGGELDLACDLNHGNLIYVMVGEDYLPENSFRYENGAIRIATDAVLSLGKGEFTVTVITDEGNDTATLNVINTVETSFDKTTVKNYVYGQDDFVSFEADFDDVTITKVLRGTNEVASAGYTYADGTFKLTSAVLDLCYGETQFTVFLSNNESYTCTVVSNVMFYTDYDNTTIHDETVSEVGHNCLYINSYDVSLADGFDGKALKWQDGNVAGLATSIYTIRNTLRENSIIWYGLEFPEGKYIVVEFDYASYGTTSGDNYIFQRVQNGSVINETFATPGDGTKLHASYIVSSDALDVLCLNFLARTTADQYLLIDNFRVTLLDNVPEQTKTLNEYDVYSGEDFTFDFNSYGLEVQDVTFNGQSVNFSHQGNKITIAQSVLPEEGGNYTITVATKLYTAVYTVRFTDDSLNVNLSETSFNYAYGTSNLVVGGTFGNRVAVTSLTRQGLYDTAPIAIDSTHYTFDTTSGLTVKSSILDKLYGSTKFVMMTTGNITTEFTVVSNVLFYTDYDNTTIHDANDSAVVYNCLYMNSATVSLVDGFDGTALKFQQGSTVAGAESIYTIRNTLRENSIMWFGLEFPEGKYIVVEFDYASYGTTSNDNYIFQRVQNGSVINETFATPGDGTKSHASYVLSCDGLNILCLNYLARTTADQYLLIDNFRVTLLDNVPEMTKVLSDFDVSGDADFTFDFNSYGLQVENVKIDGNGVSFAHNNNVITVAKASLPTAVGAHTVTIETLLYTATYTVNFTEASIAVTLTQSALEFTYGSGDLTVAGTFGESVAVTELKLYGSSTYDPTTTSGKTVDTALYSFDRTTGLTLKQNLLNTLYGTTKFVMTTTNNITTEFTVASNVLFYTDYDNTTIFDDRYSADGNGNQLAIISSMASIADGFSGKALKYQVGTSSGFGNSIYTIANPVVQASNWYNIAMTAGKYIVVEFDYTSHNTTSNDNYIFQRVQNGSVINETFETPGDGTQKHAKYVVSTDGLAVVCINNIALTSSDQYLLIDNFRITLVDSAS